MMHTGSDAIVVGAGVIGLATALRLAQAGCRVVLLERGELGREASWAGAGIIERGSYARSDALAGLRRHSVDHYAEFAAEVAALSQIDPEYATVGSLDLIIDRNQAAAAERELASYTRPAARADDGTQACAAIERVGKQRILEIEPALAMEFADALFSPAAASLRPPRMLRALATACKAVGVEIVARAAVLGLCTERGRVCGVETANGSWKSRWIVVAAGAWSSRLHPLLAQLAPLRPVRGQIVALGPAPGVLGRMILWGKHYLVPRRDGLVLAGTTQEEAGFENATTEAALLKLRSMAARLVPALRGVPVAAHWSGLRPASRDGRPYIGPVRELPGLLLATGHFRSGLTLAPVTAEIITQLVTQGSSEFDIEPFLPTAERAERGGVRDR